MQKDFSKQNMHQVLLTTLEKIILAVLEHIFFQKTELMGVDPLIEVLKSILLKNFVDYQILFLALLRIINSQTSLNKTKNTYQASIQQFLDLLMPLIIVLFCINVILSTVNIYKLNTFLIFALVNFKIFDNFPYIAFLSYCKKVLFKNYFIIISNFFYIIVQFISSK